MKQRNFIFKGRKAMTRPLDYLPMAAFTIEDEFKASLLKKGYLVKNVRRDFYFIADVAKANISYEQRVKAQFEIDSTPPQNTFEIKRV